MENQFKNPKKPYQLSHPRLMISQEKLFFENYCYKITDNLYVILNNQKKSIRKASITW